MDLVDPHAKGGSRMRALLARTALMALIAAPLNASEPKLSDARNDGLFGPIRAVSVRVEKAMPDWEPDGLPQNPPIIGDYFGCQECEYDRDGNRVKAGEIADEEFRGDVIRLRKDGSGRVVEKTYENAKGQVYRREEIGPFGITEEDAYDNAKGEVISRRFWFYDGNGHLAAYKGYDPKGIMIASSSSTIDASGNFKEERDFGPNDTFSLHFVETNDPKTDVWTFTSFQESGSIKVAVTTRGSKVVSYWQLPGDDNVFGSRFFMDPVGRTGDSYHCHEDGTCDHVISYFPDDARHNVSRVEWHDGTGTLIMSYDYEYELDSFGNWTKRVVRVWASRLVEPRLYETDYRTLKYWEK